MSKKIVFLFLALVLPGLIFVFLKKFGKNEFDLPVYFETNMDSLNRACGTSYPAPYRLPDSVLISTGWTPGRPALFVVDSTVMKVSEFKRLDDLFESGDYQSIAISRSALSHDTYEKWLSCVFMIKGRSNAVLVDSEKRIRGYYSLGSREETDRLEVEMKILLKKY